MVKQTTTLFLVMMMGIFLSLGDARAEEPIIVEADACDNRRQDDDAKTSEYRAVDHASLLAVKTSGIIQKYGGSLNVSVLDVVAYQLIDEHLHNVEHKITHDELTRVCVHVKGELEISPEQLKKIISQYKKVDDTTSVIEVAEEVNRDMSLKPQTLNEKKLLYIAEMKFWDGTKNTHYHDLLTELYSHSEYFYVTKDRSVADYVVEPSLKKASVDKLNKRNHKMQMVIETSVNPTCQSEFSPISETQNHFILFSADKNEQEIADTLIRKLLTRGAKSISKKIDKYESKHLENTKIRGQKENKR